MKFLTESDVRSAVEQSLETTARGEGDEESQILNYEYLTRVLNDRAEQNAGDVLGEVRELIEGYVDTKDGENTYGEPEANDAMRAVQLIDAAIARAEK